MSDDGDRSSAPPRALRVLVEELRAEEAPSLDDSRMERLLLARIARDDADAAARSAVTPARAGASETFAEELPDDAALFVPWDEDSVDAELWKGLRRPPLDVLGEPACGETAGPPAVAPPATLGAPAAAGLQSTASGRARRRRGATVVAAVAAVAALWAVVPSPEGTLAPGKTPGAVDLASVALAPRLEGALDLAGLRAGDVIEAVEGPVRFGREGFLSWTLSAGGRLRVVTGVGHEEPRHVVSLEQGALDVAVVPAPAEAPLDRFVIEVGDARVAVQGTAFRVVRSSQGLVVDVSRGVVAVGARGGPLGAGLRLTAPQRGAFALDGGSYRPLPARSARSGPLTGSSITDATSADERYASLTTSTGDADLIGSGLGSGLGSGSGGEPASRSLAGAGLGSHPPGALRPGSGLPGSGSPGSGSPGSGSPGSGSASGPEGARATLEATQAAATDQGSSSRGSGPSRVDAARLSVEKLRQDVTACIVRTGAATSSETRVSIASHLVVDVDAQGAARAVQFVPPIRPDLQACANTVFRGRFEGGADRLRIPLEVVLEASGH